MYIDRSGKIGIGTIFPQALLHTAEKGYFDDVILEGSVLIPTGTDTLRYNEGLRLRTTNSVTGQTTYFDFAVFTSQPAISNSVDTPLIWNIFSWGDYSLPILISSPKSVLVSHGRGREIVKYARENTLPELVVIDSSAGAAGMWLVNLESNPTNNNGAGSANAYIELRTDHIDGVLYIDFVPAQRTPGYTDFSGRISYGEFHRHMLNIFVNKGRRMLIDSLGRVGIFQTPPPGTYVPTNILTVQQGSPTDPIADSWTVYSTRETKAEVIGVVSQEDMSKYLKYFREMPVYKWRRTEGEQLRLSPMADDAGVPGEIRAYDGDGNIQGIDLYGYIGFLHVVMKGMYETIEKQQETIKLLEQRVAELEQKIQ